MVESKQKSGAGIFCHPALVDRNSLTALARLVAKVGPSLYQPIRGDLS